MREAKNLPEPLCHWPHAATTCVHPLSDVRRPNFALHRVQKDSEWSWLKSTWQATSFGQKHELVGCLRVMNRHLLAAYDARRALMLAKLEDGDDWKDGVDRSGRLQERLLFHGTKCGSRLYDVCCDGFDRAHARVCLFGKGCYFAVEPALADQYASEVAALGPSPGKPMRVVVLALVACGESVVGSRDLYPFPVKPHSWSGQRFENTVNDVRRPTIIVTAQDNQAVPLYLLAYH